MSRVFLENFIVGVSANPNRRRIEAMSMNEGALLQVSDALASKIYKYAAKKYESLDFGSIEKSKGDIDKVTEMQSVKDIIGLIELKYSEEERDSKQISVLQDIELIKNSISYLRGYGRIFNIAFASDLGILKMIYSCTVKSIIEYTTWVCISAFDINSMNGSVEKPLNIKKQNEYFKAIRKTLIDTNQAFTNGDFDKLVKELNKNPMLGHEENVMTGVILGLSITISFVLIIRLAITAFYTLKMKLKDFVEIQIALLDANVNSGELDEKVKAKQKKILDALVKLKTKLEHETNKVNPEKETKKDEKDNNVDVDF